MLQLFTYGAAHRLSKMFALLFLLSGMALTQAAAQDDRVEVLALGDSLTQGYGLWDGEGFVPQMTNWLTERGHALTLINGGVSGDTSAGGLSRVAWSITDSTDAMIVALGGNDLLRGIPPEATRANIEGILKVAQEAGIAVLLVGMEAPGNYGPDYKAAFDALYPELAELYGAAFFPTFFHGLTADGATPAELVQYMQADGIHPNPEGVKRIVAAMGPAVEALVLDVR